MSRTKPLRISNLALMQSALEDLQKETGLHFKDIKYGNGYFIFSYEKNTICHFKIKEIPGFTFALWNSKNVNLEYYGPDFANSEIIFFCQENLSIDKFKPSRSGLRASMFRVVNIEDEKNPVDEWIDFDVVDLLKFIKKNRLLAHHYSKFSNIDFYYYPGFYRVLKDYIHTRVYHYKNKVKNYFHRKYITNYCKRKCKKLNDVLCFMIDRGENFYPRLDLRFYEYKNISEKDDKKFNKVADQLEEKFRNVISFDYYSDNQKYKNHLNHFLKGEEDTFLWKKTK